MGKRVADTAIQVLGGNGYVGEYQVNFITFWDASLCLHCRTRFQVERLWRDSKLLEIGGGTNESHHKNMTRDLAGTKTIR